MKKQYRAKVCEICGVPLPHPTARQRFCPPCGKARWREMSKKRNHEAWIKHRAELAKKEKQPTLEDDIREANRLHMTYGKYKMLQAAGKV